MGARNTSSGSNKPNSTQQAADTPVEQSQPAGASGSSRFDRDSRRDGEDKKPWMMPRPTLSRQGNGEDVSKIAEYMKKQCETATELEGDSVLVLNNKIFGGLLPCILLCREEKGPNGQTNVVVHTYLMECGADRLPKQVLRNDGNGRSIEIDGTVGAVATKKLREERVRAVVEGHFGKAVNVFPAGVNYIPRELDAADEKQLRLVFQDGVEAIHRTMDNVLGRIDPLNLAEVPRNWNVRAMVDISPAKVYDSAGLPIRSDIAIEVSAINRNNDDESRFDSREIKLVVVDAFIDLMYDKDDKYVPPHQREPQSYSANAVIQSHRNPDGVMMLEYIPLAIHAISLLNADMGWSRVFRQKIARENGWRDIGAIGWECREFNADPNAPAGTKAEPGQIPVTSHNFSENAWFQLIGDAIHPGLIISIDVNEISGDSWLTSVLLDAADGDPDAYDDVIRAFDNLTGGRFSRHFNVGDELFNNNNNRIVKGYWTRGDDRFPLDDLDYLAALNIWGNNDLNAVAEWDRTNNAAGGPLDVRLEKRLRMMRHVFESEGRMVVKGYAERLVVNPKVVLALDAAIRSTGTPIELVDASDNYNGFSRRSSSNLSSYRVDPRSIRASYSRSGRDDDRDYRDNRSGRGWSYRR